MQMWWEMHEFRTRDLMAEAVMARDVRARRREPWRTRTPRSEPPRGLRAAFG